MTQEEKNRKVMNAGMVGSALGMGGGLYLAFSKQKGFWGYVGYGLLFSILGGIATRVPTFVALKVDKPISEVATESKTETETETEKEQ